MNERILVIRPGAIGDTLLTFPILQALKEQKQAYVTLVSNPAVIPLAQEFELADAVFDYEALVWSELFSAAGIRSPFLLKILQHITTAICWLRDPDCIVEHNLQDAGITHIISAPGRPDGASNTHIVTYLAGTIGMSLSDEESSHSLTQRWRPLSHPLRSIAIHPGSGGSAKCWPIAYFAHVITALWQRHIPVLLLAGPADTDRLTTLLQQIGTPPAPSLLEQLLDAPLLEVVTRLMSCSAYLGNDSGITHLAAQLGLPTIALFGPSNPNVWKPIGPTVQVLYNPLLEKLQVENVLETLCTVIGI